MGKRKEHRKRKRVQAPKGVFVGVGPYNTKAGRLRDISMGGLGFRYIGGDEPPNGSYLDIFSIDHDFYLGHVPFKIVSDFEIHKVPSSSTTMRRCCLRFKKLTSQQRAKLEQFIQDYGLGEA
jgi:c-di-GMP-binding flagellar brake protein YcgR